MQNKHSIGVWRFIPPRERAKLLLMLIALVVFVGSIFGLLKWYGQNQTMVAQDQQQTQQTEPEPAAHEQAVVPEDPSVEDLAEDQGPGILEEPPRDDDDEINIYDPAILEDVETDNTSDVAEEALVLLLHWAQGKSHGQLVEETKADIFVQDLYDDPAKHRGKLVYADGALDEVRKWRIGANSTGIEMVYFGGIKQVGGVTRTVSFCLIDGPLGAKFGDKVSLRGYFLSLYKHKGADNISPILVCSRLDPPDWLTDPASLDVVKEGSMAREARAVYYLINKIMGMSQAEILEQVDEEITPTDMKTRPEQIRGRFVKFDGALLELKKESPPPNATGLGEYFVGHLLNTDDQPCMFYVLDKPQNVEEGGLARINGAFLKNYRYVTRSSIEREASVVIGRTLTPVAPIDTSSVPLFIFGICAAVLVALAVAALVESRSERRRLKEVRQKTIDRIPRDIDQRARNAARQAREKPGK